MLVVLIVVVGVALFGSVGMVSWLFVVVVVVACDWCHHVKLNRSYPVTLEGAMGADAVGPRVHLGERTTGLDEAFLGDEHRR